MYEPTKVSLGKQSIYPKNAKITIEVIRKYRLRRKNELQ